MKKILLLIIILFTSGCHKIPEGEVNSYLNKYKSLDKEVVLQINSIIDNNGLSKDNKDKYFKLYEKQFKNMDYEFKNKTCKDNICDVFVEIEVFDYNTIQDEIFNYLVNNENEFVNKDGEYDINLYEEYKLNQMLNTSKKVKYTINFHLEKDLFDWQIKSLDNTNLLKIHGIF